MIRIYISENYYYEKFIYFNIKFLIKYNLFKKQSINKFSDIFHIAYNSKLNKHFPKITLNIWNTLIFYKNKINRD